jgi:hypothetical protein
MEIRIGGGRTATINIGESDAMNVEGVTYPTGTSVTFWNRDGDEVTIFFPTRARMKELAQRIVDEITQATGSETQDFLHGKDSHVSTITGSE